MMCSVCGNEKNDILILSTNKETLVSVAECQSKSTHLSKTRVTFGVLDRFNMDLNKFGLPNCCSTGNAYI